MPATHKQAVGLRPLNRLQAFYLQEKEDEERCGSLFVLLRDGDESSGKKQVAIEEETNISSKMRGSNKSRLIEATKTLSKIKIINRNWKKTTKKVATIEMLLLISLVVYQLIASLVQVVAGSQQLYANNFPASTKPASSGAQAGK